MAAYNHNRMPKHEAQDSLLSEDPFDRSVSRDVSPYPRGYPLQSTYSAGYVESTAYPGGYYEREGYTAASPVATKKASWFSLPKSKWAWSFLSIGVFQAVIGLALECYLFGQFYHSLHNNAQSTSQSRTVPTYLSLFIFGFVYELFLIYDALRLQNTIQVIGLCLYNLGLLVEAAVQLDQIRDAVDFLINQTPPSIDPGFYNTVYPYVVAVPGVLGLGTVLMSFVAWKLYREFAWYVWENISADPRLKRKYLSYQIYIALLKFDFFFFLAFTVQFLVVVSNTTNIEFYLTIVAIPITIILLLLAGLWTRKESVLGMIITIIVYFAAMAYFLFKLVRIYDAPLGRINDYRPARKSLTTFAVITLILMVVTIIYACICTANFGKGLRQHVDTSKKRERAASLEMDKLFDPRMPGPMRREID